MNGELKLLSALLPDDEHLQFDELESAARGARNEHAKRCETCAAEVEDLRAFVHAPSSGLRPPSPRRRGEGLPATSPLAPLAGRGWRAAPGEGAWRLLAVAALLIILATAASFAVRQYQRAENLHLAEIPIPAEVLAMRGERLQLRGAASGAALSVVEPVGTAVVSDRPLFRWNAPAGTVLKVEVFDEHFRPVAESGPLTLHQWSPPEPLPRDRSYVWQVVTVNRHLAPAPPLPDARFRIVSAEAARRIEAARRDEPSLELASLYAGAGALDDAARELDRLPPDDVAVRRLRDRVDNLP
jgi:hypothetical protein